MKLKKFIKPLVTVSALSMLLMGCAEDSSTNNGGSTTPPTVEGIFANIAQEINGHQANITDLVFKDDATAAKDVNSKATTDNKLYFVALDGVINDLATLMNANHKAGDELTNGGTTTALTGTAEDATETTLTNIGTDTVLELDSETKNVTFTRTAAEAGATPIGIPGGVFAILNADEVIALDAAIAAAKNPAEESAAAEGEAGGAAEETPVSTMTAEELQDIYNILTGKFYTVKYQVLTQLQLVNDFKQAVADAVAGKEGATLQVTKLALTKGTNYEDTTTTTAADGENIYCFDGLFAGVDTTYTKYLQLNSVNGSSNAQDVDTNTGVYKGTSGDPNSGNKIDFTAVGTPQATDVIKAYCSKAFTNTDSSAFEDLVTTYNTTKNYDNLKALIDGLVGKGVIYGEVTVE